MAIKRRTRRVVAAGAVGAATLSTLLLSTPSASAAPVVIPGVGNFDVPDQVLQAIPKGAIPPNMIPPGFQIPGITPPPAPVETVGQRAVQAAMSRIGDPYVYGATGPNAFDCSGLVQWSYGQAGRRLPRTSEEQLDAGAPVAMNNLQPGDVVSYYGGSHSSLYIGNGNIVHAATYGEPVQVAPLNSMPIAGVRRYS
jgi:hypothetical protein